MDIRSFKVNFEINAFIYDDDTTTKFAEEFLSDIKNHCTEITLEDYMARPRLTKVKESLSRLLSPIL